MAFSWCHRKTWALGEKKGALDKSICVVDDVHLFSWKHLMAFSSRNVGAGAHNPNLFFPHTQKMNSPAELYSMALLGNAFKRLSVYDKYGI